jgi:hypothetical protein
MMTLPTFGSDRHTSEISIPIPRILTPRKNPEETSVKEKERDVNWKAIALSIAAIAILLLLFIYWIISHH